RAAEEAIAAGVVGPLPPVLEEELAEALCHRIPWIERVRFLKTGAEAVAAAVRLARVVTGRERVLGCGYHGWLDWCQGAEGVPAGGAAERYGVRPDLVVLGKALANGFPLAAVGGRAELMAAASRTWISSTLATESVALAAAAATLEVMERDNVCAHLHAVGT